MFAIRKRTIDFLRARFACRQALVSDAGGSVATEYGLIAALIVVALIVAFTQLRAGLLGLPFASLITAFTEALSS